MAKIVVTLEDVARGNETGCTMQMAMELSDADKALPPDVVTPAAAVGFVIQNLWRSGTLIEIARQSVDDVMAQALADIAASEAAANRAVKQNIAVEIS